MRCFRLITVATVLFAGRGFAASKETQELQRDVAQLQEQVRTLQSGFDQRMAALQVLVQQAVDSSNKANTGLTVLNSSVGRDLERTLQTGLNPVMGVATKINNVSNDTAELRNSVSDLTVQVNKIVQQLNDISNAVKVMQAPQAAPPPSNTNPGAGAGFSPNSSTPGPQASAPPASALSSGTTPPAPAATMFNHASNDMNTGKGEFAAQEFADFIRYYPNDPFAPTAQFYIGQIHYTGGNLEQATKDFDAVLERFPENKMTVEALFLKGMSLKQSGHRDAASTEFRSLIKKYPRSDRASQASEQLRSMGLSATSPAAAAPKTLKKRR